MKQAVLQIWVLAKKKIKDPTIEASSASPKKPWPQVG
jgi:hypothetical protein